MTGKPQGDDIVVTARKTSERLSNVGLSITAATGSELSERGITSVAGLVRLEPSLQFAKTSDSTPVYTLRGVGYNESSIQAPPTTSIYQDEVPYTYPVMTKGVSLDVQQVEILKGPQGTLYGQNATGGAINFIAGKPTDHLSAGIIASLGNYAIGHFDGYASGPLTDTLSARLAVGTDQSGAWQRSYTRNDKLGEKNLVQGRLLLDWKPAGNVTATLNFNAWRDFSDVQAPQLEGVWVKSPQYVGLAATNHNPTPAQIATIPAYAAGFARILGEPLAPSSDTAADWTAGTRPHLNEHFYQSALRVDWSPAPTFNLTSLTSYEHYTQADQIDLAGNAVRQSDRYSVGKVDSFFQELRAHGAIGAGRATWTVGANYIHDESSQTITQYVLQSTSYLSGFPPKVGVFPPITNLQSTGVNTTRTLSAFGDVSVSLLSNLKLNGGVRYTDVDARLGGCSMSSDPQLVALVTGALGNGTAVVGQCFTVLSPKGLSGYYRTILHQHNVPWRVGIEWQVSTGTLVYALVSKGYKAGASPLLNATVAAQFRPVGQESLLDYEGGVKTRLLDDKLSLNVDGFYYDYRDKQLLARYIDAIFGPIQALTNVPKAHVVGAEASVVVGPVSGVTLDAAATYLKSKVDSDFANTDPYGDPVNFKGEAFPYTPQWALSGSARYGRAVSDRLNVYLSARGTYQSATVAAFGQSAAVALGYPSLAIPAYALLDLSVGIEPKRGNWRVEAWGRNVTNKFYLTSVNFIGENTTRLTGMPATYGVTVRYRY